MRKRRGRRKRGEEGVDGAVDGLFPSNLTWLPAAAAYMKFGIMEGRWGWSEKGGQKAANVTRAESLYDIRLSLKERKLRPVCISL